MVAMHETPSDTYITLHRGTKVRKCHTSRRDAFKSINASPIGRIQDQEISMLTKDYRKRQPQCKLSLQPDFNEKVALVKFYPSMDPSVLDSYVQKGYRGLVFEGTGLGHVSKYCHEAIRNAVEHDVIVAMTSQCIWGRVNMNVYDSGRDLQALGVIPLEDMLAETALVKLMWVLGQTTDAEEAKKLMRTNIAGELSPRTVLDKIGEEQGGPGGSWK
jgi:glutamyl-tRNA(Gln) amidotransferase subunit D